MTKFLTREQIIQAWLAQPNAFGPIDAVVAYTQAIEGLIATEVQLLLEKLNGDVKAASAE